MAKGKNITVKVDFDPEKVVQRFDKCASVAQKKLDSEVLKDSNFYCPMYTGTLQKSGIAHTVIGSGEIIWRTPYAREQYYGRPNKSHQHNPNAQMRWFEVAKARNKSKWEKIVNEEYSK